MSVTKTKILSQSLALFNDQGVVRTTLRKIALAMGISQGNLNYHFKTKQEIVEALYYDLVRKMDAEIGAIDNNQPLLYLLYESSKRTMGLFYRYRFLLRDLYAIMKENEQLKNHYAQLQRARKNQFRAIFRGLVAQNMFREEAFDQEYDRLYERMTILGDNWINTQELLNESISQPVNYYQSLLFEVVYPYLTESGRQEYAALKQGGKGLL